MLADVKRSAALAPLSRDHHHALAVSLRLRRATDDDAEEACRRFVAFMEADGERHFREEEAELLPHATPEMTERTLAEHATLRGHAAALRVAHGAAPAGELHEIGELLRNHVRFEEHELFPYLEETLDEATLQDLAERLG
jgi:hypothetical protein